MSANTMWNSGMVQEIVECGCCEQDFMALVLTAHYMEGQDYDPNDRRVQEIAANVYYAFEWAVKGEGSKLVNVVPVVTPPKED